MNVTNTVSFPLTGGPLDSQVVVIPAALQAPFRLDLADDPSGGFHFYYALNKDWSGYNWKARHPGATGQDAFKTK